MNNVNKYAHNETDCRVCRYGTTTKIEGIVGSLSLAHQIECSHPKQQKLYQMGSTIPLVCPIAEMLKKQDDLNRPIRTREIIFENGERLRVWTTRKHDKVVIDKLEGAAVIEGSSVALTSAQAITVGIALIEFARGNSDMRGQSELRRFVEHHTYPEISESEICNYPTDVAELEADKKILDTIEEILDRRGVVKVEKFIEHNFDHNLDLLVKRNKERLKKQGEVYQTLQFTKEKYNEELSQELEQLVSTPEFPPHSKEAYEEYEKSLPKEKQNCFNCGNRLNKNGSNIECPMCKESKIHCFDWKPEVQG